MTGNSLRDILDRPLMIDDAYGSEQTVDKQKTPPT